ncbi:MAG: DUF1064 domain-containing protein [Ignavibacteriaceae bacterium]
MYQIKRQWTNANKQLVNGFRYDSGFEAQYGMFLESELNAKRINNFDRQINLPLIVNGYKVCDYRIDFIVYHLDNSTEYVEVNGYQTDVWKLKWKLFESLYSDLPEVKLTIIRQGNYHPPKLRKVKYSNP